MDYETNRLLSGVLQLAEGSHTMIDETHLQEGALNSVGVENARLIKNLMELQKGKSNILPADLVLPFCPLSVESSEIGDAEALTAWRWYLASLKSLPHSIEPDMQKEVEERVKTVGLVCRSWLEAVAGPYCWTDIDIEQWCRRSNRPLHLVDSAVRKLVRRSNCSFTRISAYKLGDSGFSFIANYPQQAMGGPVAPASTHVHSQQQSHAYTSSFNCQRSSEEVSSHIKERKKEEKEEKEEEEEKEEVDRTNSMKEGRWSPLNSRLYFNASDPLSELWRIAWIVPAFWTLLAFSLLVVYVFFGLLQVTQLGLLEAIDHILQGAQNLVVPIKSNSRRKLQESPTAHNGCEFC
ncbi:unnamed protein product [Camellia sinensis]